MKKKTFYSFLLAFLLLVAVIIINRKSFNEMREYTHWVNHSQGVITSLEELSNHFKSAQIYTPTYDSIGETKFYSLYKTEAESISTELKKIKELVKDNRQQASRVNLIAQAISVHLNALMHKNIVELIVSGEGWRLEKIFQIHDLINIAIAEEKKLLANRKEELKRSTNLTGTLTIVFSICAVVLILITFLSNIILSRKRLWLEGFLESVLNTSQNGIITYKAIRENGKITDFRIAFANKSIERLLGIDPVAVINKRLSEMPSYLRDSDIFDKYITVAETGKQMEFETLYDQGTVKKWFFVSLGKLEDGVTATFHDISNLKKYEDELKMNIRQLEESNTELEQYAYAASHDLQEPLRKIRTFGSYLQESQSEKLDEKGKALLEKILSSAERMGALIKDILGFSSIKKESSIVATDLNKALANAVQDLELMISQKEAEINHETLPVIEAIPLQMNQLFYNLLNNALKFTRQNVRPAINISCRVLPAAETVKYIERTAATIYYEIVIRDNGMGFSAQFSEQIFGLFKRLADKKNFSGSGIGLALCRKVVANHNGVIFAEGKENEGASFHIILPEKQIM
jgi:signal transduction histidine kinase